MADDSGEFAHQTIGHLSGHRQLAISLEFRDRGLGVGADGAGGLQLAVAIFGQRALTEYGYGQLKPTGLIGADTQAAITKFERDRKLPVTGQMSDRLVKELSAMTGRPIE